MSATSDVRETRSAKISPAVFRLEIAGGKEGGGVWAKVVVSTYRILHIANLDGLGARTLGIRHGISH